MVQGGLGFDMKKSNDKRSGSVVGCNGSRCYGGGGSSAKNVTSKGGGVVVVRPVLVG